jgi:type VI secretion system protein ImpC
MPGRMGFEFRFSEPRARDTFRRREDSAMRILVMGDFSGRGVCGVAPAAELASRPIVSVDVDNFDQAFSRFAPRALLPSGPLPGPDLALQFEQLEDFHPDHLYRALDLFRALREARARLQNPATFQQAAADLRQAASAQGQPKGSAAGADSKGGAEPEDEAALFERLLGPKPAGSSQASKPASTQRVDVHTLLQRIMAPYIVPEQAPFQAQYVASVDAAMTEQMRWILHHPAFQALESLWRGVHWLVANLEVGEQLQLHLLDITKAELLADVQAAGGDPARTDLYRLVVDQNSQVPGGEPWSLLVGTYTFGPDARDVSLLASLGGIAAQAGGPFLAAADPSVLGCRSLIQTPDPRDWHADDSDAEECWHALRVSAAAPWLGLTLPRVLLRLPYGKDTDRAEPFEFEELTPARTHEAYLWGNPALACALLIGRSFSARGWAMEPGDQLDIEDLPAHTFEQDGEPQLQACAEVYLTERAGQAMLNRGVMPWLSHKNRNAIRVMRLQSLADPVKPLSGPWR